MNVSQSSTSSWYLFKSFVFPFYPVTYCYIGWRDVFASIELLSNEGLRIEVWKNVSCHLGSVFFISTIRESWFIRYLLVSVLYLLRYFLFPFHSSSCKMVDGTQSLRKDQVRTGRSENYANDEERENWWRIIHTHLLR